MAANLYERVAAAYEICGDFIVAVDFSATRAPSHVRFRLTFGDRSCLYVSEDWQSGALGAYSYYWLDSANNLIIGWDNAPHHVSISTHPHHKHVGARTSREPSDDRTMEAVLTLIRGRSAAQST